MRCCLEDVADPLEIGGTELPVPRLGAGRVDQSLGLEEADLGDADIGEFRLELGDGLSDVEALLCRHASRAAIRRNLPMITSSPAASSA